MFRQQFTVKKDVILKFSERKFLKESVLLDIKMQEQDFFELSTKRTLIHCVTVTLHNAETAVIYIINKVPYFFKYNNKFYPTVFLLWKYPNVTPYITIPKPVASYLSSGADLMLPGVITPPKTTGLPQFPTIKENDTLYINLKDNLAAFAVGFALMDTSALIEAHGRGKCVKVLHYFGDRLCNLDNLKAVYPEMGPVPWTKLPSQTNYNNEFPPLGGAKKETNLTNSLNNLTTNGNSHTESVDNSQQATDKNDAAASASALEEATTPDSVDLLNDEENLTDQDKMDKILMYCFYVAIKYDKRFTLPILTSTFFRNHVIPNCPEGKSLDIKKTSYKKLKTFLDKMKDLGVIKTAEPSKGIEHVIAINKEHPSFGEFYIKPELRPKQDEQQPQSSSLFEESFLVTASVAPIFAESHFSRGDVLPASTIRNVVSAYVKQHNLQNPDNRRLVCMDDLLRKLCRTEVSITWEELNEKIINCMTSCLKVTTGTEHKVSKGLTNILMSVENRSGNKKVTLVDNLEYYGINIQEFAKSCQHGAAASTSISKPAHKKCEQLLIQGNQIALVHNLLTTKYGIPKRFISGLEFAPKKK